MEKRERRDSASHAIISYTTLGHTYHIPFKVSHWWDGEKGRDSASHAIISYIVTQC
jgi:hypothetical protein